MRSSPTSGCLWLLRTTARRRLRFRSRWRCRRRSTHPCHRWKKLCIRYIPSLGRIRRSRSHPPLLASLDAAFRYVVDAVVAQKTGREDSGDEGFGDYDHVSSSNNSRWQQRMTSAMILVVNRRCHGCARSHASLAPKKGGRAPIGVFGVLVLRPSSYHRRWRFGRSIDGRSHKKLPVHTRTTQSKWGGVRGGEHAQASA